MVTEAASFFTNGAGVPRYIGMWLLLTPLALGALLLGRVRLTATAVFVAITLPSLLAGSLPLLTRQTRYVVVTAGLVGMSAWIIRRIYETSSCPDRTPSPVPWRAVALLGLLTLAVRAPLAWLDPGISNIGLATEHAVRELLAGVNPYAEPNPYANFGTYQYPVGTIVANLPGVAFMPSEVLGEEHLGIRVTSWAVDILNVMVIVAISARWGRASAGIAAGAAYALCAPLVRDSGLSTANDLLLALFILLSVAAIAERRRWAAGVAVGLAIAVKPPAVLLVPLLLPVLGWLPVLVAGVVPLLLQAPLLLWQAPGIGQLEAFAEPAARTDGPAFLSHSIWYPLFSLRGSEEGLLTPLALLGILVAAGAALWAGARLRARPPAIGRTAAAVSLPLLIVFALAPVPRLNYQDWYAPPLILAIGHTVGARGARTAPHNEADPAPGPTVHAH